MGGASMNEVRCFSRWLTVKFPEPYLCRSWAVHNGGSATTDLVAWLFLEINEIEKCGDIREWFISRLKAEGLQRAVGLLTSRRLHQYVESRDEVCHVVATVGLSNALAAGDPESPRHPAGTINILCAFSTPLTPEASLEALALAAEARTAAILDARIPSLVSGRDATGTGTDCIVIAHPEPGAASAAAQEYCGKHTGLGHRIGHHVRNAVSQGVEIWLRESRSR